MLKNITKKLFTYFTFVGMMVCLLSTSTTNCAMAASSRTITVAQDGSGNYKTVQAAINSISGNTPTTINIKKGTYKEVVTIPSNKSNITIVGENPSNTHITYDNYNAKSNGKGGTYGTGGSASFFISGSNITIKNLTISNSFVEKGNSGEQAVAVNVNGSRVIFNNCSLKGNQDTLLCDGGTQYFYKCYIEGDVDFIFGRSQAYFDKCNIHSLNRGSSVNNGYITAARTEISETYGFVFNECSLTAASGTSSNSVYLGRPWCPSGTSVNKAAVAFINCTMDKHISSVGWTSMSNVPASHGRFYEYGSKGSGAIKSNTRKQLSPSQANNYTKTNVLKGWNPSV